MTPTEMGHHDGAIDDEEAVEEIPPGSCLLSGKKRGNHENVKKGKHWSNCVGERVARWRMFEGWRLTCMANAPKAGKPSRYEIGCSNQE